MFEILIFPELRMKIFLNISQYLASPLARSCSGKRAFKYGAKILIKIQSSVFC